MSRNRARLALALLPMLIAQTGAKALDGTRTPAAHKQQDANQASGGQTLIFARIQAAVRAVQDGDTGVVTFPVPGEYREQIPLTLQVTTTPESALIKYRYYKREDGRNWLCAVTVKPPGIGAVAKVESLVLVDPRSNKQLPRVLPTVPPEAQAWTRSTACVQSDDPDIKSKAATLGSSSDDVETYARKVIAFTSKNEGTGEVFNSLDARRALGCGGSCTSRANLAAALLRAHGIAARTVAHLPTWSGELYEHWLVEYWHPGNGWVWLESTQGQFQPPPTSVVVLAESNPEDEDKAFDALHLRYVMPGAAYLSVCELSPELVSAPGLIRNNCSNIAKREGTITGTPDEIKSLHMAAHNAFAQLSGENGGSRQPTQLVTALEAAAHCGLASAMIAALQGKPISLVVAHAGGTSARNSATDSAANYRLSQDNADESQILESAYQQKLAVSQKKNGYSHPQTIHAMWELAQYYLDTRQYSQAEKMLRVLNDASKKNPKNTPISNTDISSAYAVAIAGMRSSSRQSRLQPTVFSSPSSPAPTPSASASSVPSRPAQPHSTQSGSSPLSPTWFLAGSDPRDYEMGRDSGGVFIRARSSSAAGFGTVMQSIPPTQYLGKRLRFSANVRTVDCGRAQLWMRVDGRNQGEILQFDNMSNRPITGTTGWNKYECVLDVPRESTNIGLGIILTTAGQAWLDSPRVEEVGSSVASTSQL